MLDVAKRRFFRGSRVDDNRVRLPWLVDAAQFTEQCTRCSKCIDSCETQIIVKGDGGFPTIDFSIDECTFCYKCADACPEPLFLASSDQPWTAKADINEHCLAKKNVECRSCGEMCEPMAITFKLAAGQVAQPELKLEQCNGCGACVKVCPSNAITVSINNNER